VRALEAGYIVEQDVEDDTLPGGPRKKIVRCVAPFDRCDREEDYRVAWAESERRMLPGSSETT
jgi:hypothetical protein